VEILQPGLPKIGLYHRLGGHEGIAVLVRHFYADVRQHKVIGPIFIRQIQDWNAHLEKIGEFWARITGGPSSYNGQMPALHVPLHLEDKHFNAWLSLWKANCKAHLKPREAEEMNRLANDIAERLKAILSGAFATAKRPVS
jgi:hemoglobin